MSKKNTPAPEEETVKLPDVLPVLPLKDAVIFPYVIVPLSVGRDKSVLAVDQALADDRLILLLSQKDPATEEPKPEDLHTLGTAGLIMRMLKLPDGRIRILVQGVARVRVEHMSQTEPFLQARIQRLEDGEADVAAGALEGEALVRSVKEGLERAQQLGKNISAEVMTVATNLDDPGRLADLAASNLELKVEEAQQVLETLAPQERLQKVSDLLQREIQLLTMQQEISSQARGEMDKSQREYFLRQQLKAIQQELGEGDELTEEVGRLPPPARREEAARGGAHRGRASSSSGSSAATPTPPRPRSCAPTSTGSPACPGSVESDDQLDLENARQILDEDHYDLEKIKERILEYLAVRKLKSDTKRPDPLLRRPARRRQDLARALDRPRHGPQVRAHVAGRRARRGRDPRPPPHLRRRAAGAHHPGDPPGRHREPGLHARRDRQDRRRLPRRSLVGAARGARPGAELDLPRPLPRRRLRPVEGDVHHHRQPARHDPAGLPRPHGSDPALRLHAGGEAAHRAPPSDSRSRWRRTGSLRPHIQFTDAGVSTDHRRLHPRGRPAQPRARDRRHLPQGGGAGGERQGQPGVGRPGTRRALPRAGKAPRRRAARAATASASRPASPGRRPAATCCSSRSWRCPARVSCCSPASSAT